MQYLLTKEEYDAILEAHKKEIKKLNEVIQDLCTRVAVNEPINDGAPWGCIRSDNKENRAWYCGGCPALDQCPYKHKEWSK